MAVIIQSGMIHVVMNVCSVLFLKKIHHKMHFVNALYPIMNYSPLEFFK